MGKIYNRAKSALISLTIKMQRGVNGKIQIPGKLFKLRNKGCLAIGNGCVFRSMTTRIIMNVREGGEIKIGDGVFINDGVRISSSVRVSIGDHSKIGDFTVIDDNSFHEVDQEKGVGKKEVTIGRNVWIARNCIILLGVTIGDHSVIGAGAVVTRDVPAKTLVAGNPARTIRAINCSDNYIRP